ncbi:NAD-dependent epimerase/dehydratase family protein [Halovulum sp. GXIMD14793]
MTRHRLLLVGASGRVGQLVANSWRRSAPEADITLQTRHKSKTGNLVWSPEDGTDALNRDIARNGPIAAMIMLAGVTPATGDDMSVNTRVAMACLHAAVATDIPRILLASSSAIYGAGDGTAFSESCAPAPASDYARSKLEMEQAADIFRTKGLEVCALRIGNVAGADALLLNASSASATDPIRIDQFASQTGPIRNYIGPDTFARVLAYLSLTASPLPPVLNIAAPEPIPMESLAKAAALPWTYVPALATAIRSVTLDCSLLSGLYRFNPEDSDPAEMVRQWRRCT